MLNKIIDEIYFNSIMVHVFLIILAGFIKSHDLILLIVGSLINVIVIYPIIFNYIESKISKKKK